MNKNYSYGRRSLAALESADPRLQQVFHLALGTGLIDISVLEGRRSKERQNRLFDIGKSRVEWPFGKHNVLDPAESSLAVDAAPFVRGEISYDWRHCIFLAGIVCGLAAHIGIKIRWGGNWDMDGEPITDQDFQDLLHYEIP